MAETRSPGRHEDDCDGRRRYDEGVPHSSQNPSAVSLPDYLAAFDRLLARVDPGEVNAFVDAVEAAWRRGSLVFVIGNGGSAANASHLCEDLGKGTLTDFEGQRRLRIMSLTDNTPYLLAWGNDVGYESVFVEQLKNLGTPDALLIAISGSGNSPNVLRAVEYANRAGMETFSVTGFDGGQLRRIALRGLHVPSNDMGAVEAAHLVLFHYALDVLRERFRAGSPA